MANKEDLLQDLNLIRQTMERSDQLLVMDGRLGIINGLLSLTGVTLGWLTLPSSPAPLATGAIWVDLGATFMHFGLQIIIGLAVLSSCLLISYISANRTKRQSPSVWNHATRKFAYSLGVPLFIFGMVALWLLVINPLFVPAILLIGSGLALHSALHLSRHKITLLSVIWLLTGMLALLMPDLSHIWLAAGFGLGNIVQGVLLMLNAQNS